MRVVCPLHEELVRVVHEAVAREREPVPVLLHPDLKRRLVDHLCFGGDEHRSAERGDLGEHDGVVVFVQRHVCLGEAFGGESVGSDEPGCEVTLFAVELAYDVEPVGFAPLVVRDWSSCFTNC